MTDDTDETFTTDSSPGERVFEKTVDDAVAFFEAAFDTNKHSYGPRMAGVSDPDERETEWIDPKGDPGAQNLDVSNLNPLDMESFDNNGHDTGGTR